MADFDSTTQGSLSGLSATKKVNATSFYLNSFPSQCLEQVFHIGSMNKNDKGDFSHEGHGLSISLDPEAWEKIAKLGGQDWWALEKTNGQFLNFHNLAPHHTTIITAWGINEGLCMKEEGHGFQSFDGELEYNLSFSYLSYAEALDEAEGYDLTEDDLYTTSILVATDEMREALQMDVKLNCLDHLTCLWVERNTNFDGVWWEDEYGALSAPRGVILPGKLSEWTKNVVVAELES